MYNYHEVIQRRVISNLWDFSCILIPLILLCQIVQLSTQCCWRPNLQTENRGNWRWSVTILNSVTAWGSLITERITLFSQVSNVFLWILCIYYGKRSSSSNMHHASSISKAIQNSTSARLVATSTTLSDEGNYGFILYSWRTTCAVM